jgi:hypothetical protein
MLAGYAIQGLYLVVITGPKMIRMRGQYPTEKAEDRFGCSYGLVCI